MQRVKDPYFPEPGEKLLFEKLPEFVYPMFTNVLERAKNVLVPGTEYTVRKCEVYSSWCAVWLEEFPDEDHFFHRSIFKKLIV